MADVRCAAPVRVARRMARGARAEPGVRGRLCWAGEQAWAHWSVGCKRAHEVEDGTREPSGEQRRASLRSSERSALIVCDAENIQLNSDARLHHAVFGETMAN